MSTPLSVGIVGGGIGGLTAAAALVRQGFRVRVYEQASHFIPHAGAGFGFSPNGQVCLASIGIETRPLLHQFHRLVHINREGEPTVESNLFEEIYERHGFTIGGCLRADLVDTLKESLPANDILQYSHKLVAMEQHDNKVRLEFQGLPEEEEHDLVIGADGIHSKVAELLDIDHTPPVYSGANIFYGLINDPMDFENPILARDNSVIQGNCTGEFIAFRAGPDDKKVQVWATTYPSEASPPREEWGVTDPSSPELGNLLQAFPSGHPIHELASRTDRLLHFGLFYRKHKDVWSKGRTCLLGDSCHATLPYVGQGANQAIEDAIVLAQCLSECDYEQAFQQYYEQRSRRTKRVVRMATIMNKLHHAQNPILARLRDYFFHSFAKGNVMTKIVEKEIVEECPIKDYAQYK